VPTFRTEDIREAILQVLEHDRWNSNLSDEHIAEKVGAMLKGKASRDQSETD
jgi:hypothetical protein